MSLACFKSEDPSASRGEHGAWRRRRDGRSGETGIGIQPPSPDGFGKSRRTEDREQETAGSRQLAGGRKKLGTKK
jgi:hypothetical protein